MGTANGRWHCLYHRLAVGLAHRQFYARWAQELKEAAKPEWSSKRPSALGDQTGYYEYESGRFTYELALAGAAAAFVAYLLFWPIAIISHDAILDLIGIRAAGCLGGFLSAENRVPLARRAPLRPSPGARAGGPTAG